MSETVGMHKYSPIYCNKEFELTLYIVHMSLTPVQPSKFAHL